MILLNGALPMLAATVSRERTDLLAVLSELEKQSSAQAAEAAREEAGRMSEDRIIRLALQD